VGFKEFSYNSVDEIMEDVTSFGLKLKFSNNIDVLKKSLTVNGHHIPNSLAVHPMEGCDGKSDGSPDELTIRRYERFAKGGAGLLWFEAVAVVPEGRANPRQLWINDNNLDAFKKLYEKIIGDAHSEYGDEFNPVCIMQLTHSGRYSKPNGIPAPILACHNPYLDAAQKIDENLPVIKDEELEKLEEVYVKAAVLAEKAGFNGVDVKCCHRYLNSELLSAFTRKGRYGETFEGRTRFLLNIIDKIKAATGSDFIVTTRLNICDAIPYPYGWGTDKQDFTKYDLEEPVKLVKLLYSKDVKIINLTMGNPYYNPHVNRPYDKGPYIPEESQIAGISRMISGIGEVQKAVPDMVVVGTGYSWLRQFSSNLAAGCLENGMAKMIGYGREAFAYPDFARDLCEKGILQKEKCCIACGKCSEIMKAGGKAGCVIRDGKVYASLYKEYCK
jgi:2,4-dienoyl-CoA reductase-like NADH-dependent reductase (Old Yellow Enzyme family)